MNYKDDQAECRKKIKEGGRLLECDVCRNTRGLVKIKDGHYACQTCCKKAYAAAGGKI